MNKCIFTGRLTKDPTFKKQTAKMDAFVAFSLAVKNGFGDRERTFYLDCSTYGWLAEEINKTCYKGVKVIVEGTFYTYDSKYGSNRLCMDLKSCEIVQHTKAYLEEHPEVLREIDAHISDLINEAVLFSEKKVENKKAVSWGEIEKLLDSEEYSKVPTVTNKLGLAEDEDGFIMVDEDEVDLPFE